MLFELPAADLILYSRISRYLFFAVVFMNKHYLVIVIDVFASVNPYSWILNKLLCNKVNFIINSSINSQPLGRVIHFPSLQPPLPTPHHKIEDKGQIIARSRRESWSEMQRVSQIGSTASTFHGKRKYVEMRLGRKTVFLCSMQRSMDGM